MKILFAFLAAVLAAGTIKADVIDRVVAEVNQDVITLSELNEEGRAFLTKLAIEVPAENRDIAFKQALNDILEGLIDKKLITQEAEKRNLFVSDEEIDSAISRIITANKMTPDDLQAELQNSGLSMSTYRNNIKSQILQTKLISREVSSKVVITEDMILDYYDTEYTEQVDEGGYYLLQIGVGWGDTEDSRKSTAALFEDKMTARKTTERVRKLALNGQDFNELARKFSDLPSAVDGGDIGIFEEDDMASYMKDAVISLKPGEISQIVETPVGFQFFKLLSNKEGGIVIQAPYESVKENIREQLYQETMEKEFSLWIKKLKEESYIKKML